MRHAHETAWDGTTITLKRALLIYDKARRFVEAAFPEDLEWIKEISRTTWEENTFLEQYAWVVYVSGFRVSTIERLWPRLRQSWLDFEPRSIVKYAKEVRTRALYVFHHERKVAAVLQAADKIVKMTVPVGLVVSRCSGSSFLAWISHWPYMGEANSAFMARNMGFRDFSKPDVHLRRLAASFGYREDVAKMCHEIAEARNSSSAEIDLVLWRYSSEAEINRRSRYRSHRLTCQPSAVRS